MSLEGDFPKICSAMTEVVRELFANITLGEVGCIVGYHH